VNAGALAYANTRVRAARGRLLRGERLVALRIADTPPARAAALLDLQLGDGTALGAYRVLMNALAADYARVLRSVPGDRSPFLALRSRHEIENLKLVYRALTRGHPDSRWTPWWRPIGELELDDFRDLRSLPELVNRAGRYREILAAGGEPFAVERALDRFATSVIAAAARDSEPDVAAILDALVRQRENQDDEIVRWCRRAFLRGPFSRAAAAALLLVEEAAMAGIVAMAEAV
jgi:hypothetical protein